MIYDNGTTNKVKVNRNTLLELLNQLCYFKTNNIII